MYHNPSCINWPIWAPDYARVCRLICDDYSRSPGEVQKGVCISGLLQIGRWCKILGDLLSRAFSASHAGARKREIGRYLPI